jgi:hypothetical protein
VIKGATDGLLAEVDCSFDPCVIGLAKGVQRWVLLERKHDVAELDAAVCEKTREEAGLFHLVFPTATKGFGDNALRVTIRRVRRADRGDAHAYERPLLSCRDEVLMGLNLVWLNVVMQSAYMFLRRLRFEKFEGGKNLRENVSE